MSKETGARHHHLSVSVLRNPRVCQYYNNLEFKAATMSRGGNLERGSAKHEGVKDIEDLVTLGHEEEVCIILILADILRCKRGQR